MNKPLLLIATVVVALTNQASVFACTISEDMHASVPLNSTDIPNDIRLKLANMVVDARKWPVAEIKALASAGAYIKERDPAKLAAIRAQRLREYLLQLGVKPEHIWIETPRISAPYELDSAGYSGYLQFGVTLYPVCEGDCGRLCHDPRVTPDTRLIQ